MREGLLVVQNRNFSLMAQAKARTKILDLLVQGYVRWLYCDFSDLDLSDINFAGCDFDQCFLVKTRITKASNTHWHSCDLTGADFSHGDLRNTYAINCKSEGLELMGAAFTWDCHFLSGLKTVRDSDAWRLLYWISLVDNSVLAQARALIPPHIITMLEQDFERDPA